MQDLVLADILPNLSSGLSSTAFLFGAGTSAEAGYPMMGRLTADVVASLSSDQTAELDHVLSREGLVYDAETMTPNIEQIADLVVAHAVNTAAPRAAQLEQTLREKITERILSVDNPDLQHHVRFFEALNRRAFGLHCCIHIFTTNYDLLFETAAAYCGVPLETGFIGPVERYFSPTRLKSTYGYVSSGKFFPERAMTVRLIKLHGSVSWVGIDGRVRERHPLAIFGDHQRIMVLPRRRKVLDTLQPPYDALFAFSSAVIGSECKYVASCGFSFGDEHINQHLIEPKLRSGQFRLFVLSEQEPLGIADLRTLPNFYAGFAGSRISAGVQTAEGTDRWMFRNFVDLF